MELMPKKIIVKKTNVETEEVDKVESTKQKAKQAAKQIAIEEVKKFEEMRSRLRSMESEFEVNYPEAKSEIDTISEFKDEVQELINKAKELVRNAGETIGEFKYQAKFSRACYNPEKILKTCVENDDAELLLAMAKAGFMKINLDTESSLLFFETNPQYKELINDAWEERQPLTPSVSVPKI